MNLNQIIRAIRKLVTEPIIRLQDTTKRFSEPLTLDLSVARNQVEFTIYGDVMIVESMDGVATVCFNNAEDSQHTLRIGRKLYQDFWRFFITNTAQAGKTLKLIVGREGCFDITETDYWLNLLKDAQDDAKVVLDAVQVGTDKIIVSGATEAKQDTIIANQGKTYSVTPSDDILLGTAAQLENTTAAMSLSRSTLVLQPGAYRVKFEMCADDSSDHAFGQIYVNGIARGTLRDRSSEAYAEYIEELGLQPGDLVQLYGGGSGAPFSGTFLRNWEICGVSALSNEVGSDII